MKVLAADPGASVDLDTAARMADVTRRTVQNKISAGTIPPQAVRMDGRRKLVSVEALRAVFGPLAASPLGGEISGTVPGSFPETPSELAEVRAQAAAKDAIIASLQATLDHERRDREHERENWRKSLERAQANLLAAQDTPTARALAGAPKPGAVEIVNHPPKAKTKPRREDRKPVKPPWWRTMFR